VRLAVAAAVALLLAGCGGGLVEATPPPTPAPSNARTTPAPSGPTEVRTKDETFARKAALAPDGGVRVQALDLLDRVLRSEAANPRNAWALAHGMLAYGRDFKATDGRLAAEVLVGFLEDTEHGPGFPAKRGDVRVEPHPDLVVKSLLEAGWGLDEPLPGTKVTPRALVETSRSRYVATTSPNDLPWTLDAWCAAARAPEPPSVDWTTGAGAKAHLGGVAGDLLATLEKETYFLRRAKEAGTPVQKRRQGIFAYTCGGSHLFQGAAACVGAGFPSGDGARTRLALQIELYLHRVGIETDTVDAALVQAPEYRSILYNQDVKFLGHLLEALGKAERDGLWTPAPSDRALLDMAETRLVFHVLQQEKIGTYRPEALAALRDSTNKDAQDPMQGFQFYLDLVGDAAHARHGLDIQAALRADRAP